MPLTASITINGETVAFNIKMSVPVAIWDSKSSRAKGRSPEATRINRYLESINARLVSLYQNLTKAGEIVTPQILRDEFLGVEAKNTTLLTIFDEFNERQESLIGINITQSTFNKFDLTARRLEEFLRKKRNRKDIPIRQVDRTFVLDFEAFLKVEHGLSLNSSEKLMRIFKRITTMCFRNGMMKRDSFCDVRLKKEKKDRGYLTRAELELFINYKPENKRLERVKDRFIFCCFTGFDFSTSSSLTPKNIVQTDDGSIWIETHRVKTGVASKVKLLDIQLSILRKYEKERNTGYLLPVISNAKYNDYLKAIAAILGIQKRVTSHLARHTKLATTQIYARIVDQTVSREMDKLSAALSGTSFSLNDIE